MADRLAPSNGRFATGSSKSATPSDQMSLRASTWAESSTCSRDM
jgi:hypothetical protein